MSFCPAVPSAISVEVQSIGSSHPMRRMRPHEHLFFELLVCAAGRGTLVVGDRELALGPRRVVALPSGVEHDCRRFGTLEGWSIIFLPDGAGVDVPQYLALGGRVPRATPFDAFRSERPGRQRPIVLREEAFEAACMLIDSMQRELTERPVGYDVMVRSALQMLLVTVNRGIADKPGEVSSVDNGPARAFIARVFAQIDEHYAEDGYLRAAARRLDVQPGYLTTKLRRLTGRTYGSWVIERRMIEARRLLAQTNLGLGDIAARVGYAEVESFVRRFGRHHRMTPAAWRRAARSRRAGCRDDSSDVESRSIGA